MTTTSSERAGGPLDARFVPNLKGVTGRLCLCVRGESKLVLDVNDGATRIVAVGAEAPDATLHCNDLRDLGALLRGEMNAVVAALRGSMFLTGDREFGSRVMLGLNAGSPFKGERLGELG